MLTQEEIKAYLRRIGIDGILPPTKAFLFELHKAHVRSIPWETVDIFTGRPVLIDVNASVQLMLNRRSGYCFHLNGAFGELLRSLGYTVTCHRAGVQPLGEQPRVNSFHLGTTVSLADKEAGERWIVDVGLGDMPFEPLPLQAGIYRQGALEYKVTASGAAEGGWRLEHDPHASFAGVDYAPEAVPDLEEFKPKHEHYSRSPESPWVNLFLVRHRHATGSNELRGCIWTKREQSGSEKTEIQSKTQWLDLLGDIFGEHLVAYTNLERDDLWKRVWEKHQEWKRTKGSV